MIKGSLKKKMLLGFTVIFFVVQLIMIIISTLLIDDFLIESNASLFKSTVENIDIEGDIDVNEVEMNIRQNVGGFVFVQDTSNPRGVREIDRDTINEIVSYLDSNNEAVYSSLDDINMILAMKISENLIVVHLEQIQIIDNMTRLLNIYLGLVSIIVFAILFGLTNHYLDYFLKPVLKIKDATKKISNFQFDQKLEIKTNDELADLANSINEMSEKLQQDMYTLIDKERLASLGEIVAGVAHEINTPLGVSVGASSHLLKSNEEVRKRLAEGELTEDKFVAFLKTIDESTGLMVSNLDRAAKLVKNFKRISVDQTSESKNEFYVKEYIETMIYTLKHEYKEKDIKFIVECESDIKLKSYPGIFAQILTILLMNSIVHGFKNRVFGEVKFQVIRHYGSLKILYSDNGHGIASEHLDKIFEPFFTTNREGGGSGLGLNICHNLIVQKLKGEINCFSEVEKGTTFVITIPEERGHLSYGKYVG